MPRNTILIYDDDLAESLAKVLSNSRPYVCFAYSEANRLLEDLRNLKFDLAIIDRAFGVERRIIQDYGFDFASSLSNNAGEEIGNMIKELFPAVPIISLSGYDDKPDYATLHITKPVHTKDLIKTIDEFMKR